MTSYSLKSARELKNDHFTRDAIEKAKQHAERVKSELEQKKNELKAAKQHKPPLSFIEQIQQKVVEPEYAETERELDEAIEISDWASDSIMHLDTYEPQADDLFERNESLEGDRSALRMYEAILAKLPKYLHAKQRKVELQNRIKRRQDQNAKARRLTLYGVFGVVLIVAMVIIVPRLLPPLVEPTQTPVFVTEISARSATAPTRESTQLPSPTPYTTVTAPPTEIPSSTPVPLCILGSAAWVRTQPSDNSPTVLNSTLPSGTNLPIIDRIEIYDSADDPIPEIWYQLDPAYLNGKEGYVNSTWFLNDCFAGQR